MMSSFVEKAMRLALEWVSLEVSGYNFGVSKAGRDSLRAHLEAREAVTQRLAEALKYVIEHNRAPDGYVRASEALQAYEESNK